MKSMKTRLQFLPKGIVMIAFLTFGLLGCEQEDINVGNENAQVDESINPVYLRKGKIDICHYSSDDDKWFILSVNPNAWDEHSLHGDVWLDQDGDGYTPFNECGIGSMDDCDDLDADINPGAEEVCDNGIDDDCDGLVDEDCTPDWPTVLIGTWEGTGAISPYPPHKIIIDPSTNTFSWEIDFPQVVNFPLCAFNLGFISDQGNGRYKVAVIPTGSCSTSPEATLEVQGNSMAFYIGNEILYANLTKQ